MFKLTKYETSPRRVSGKIIRHGCFKCSFRHEYITIFSFIAIVVLWAVYFLSGTLGKLTDDVEFNFDLINLTISIATAAWAGLWAFLSIGRDCEYTAGETEMDVRGPGKKHEIFYYSDVQEVKFDEIRGFGIWRRGYLVTVVTGVREIKYRCIFDSTRTENASYKTIKQLPFYILAINCGLLDENLYKDEDSEVRTIDEAFMGIEFRSRLDDDE